MSDPLTQIMAAIATIQLTMTPPTGQQAVQQATDELPDTLNVFPAFVNYEEQTDPQPGLSFGYGADILKHTIKMALYFMPMQGKYSVRERRPWVSVMVKAFNANANLNGSVAESHLGPITYAPVKWNGLDYVGMTFTLYCQESE